MPIEGITGYWKADRGRGGSVHSAPTGMALAREFTVVAMARVPTFFSIPRMATLLGSLSLPSEVPSHVWGNVSPQTSESSLMRASAPSFWVLGASNGFLHSSNLRGDSNFLNNYYSVHF